MCTWYNKANQLQRDTTTDGLILFHSYLQSKNRITLEELNSNMATFCFKNKRHKNQIFQIMLQNIHDILRLFSIQLEILNDMVQIELFSSFEKGTV